MAAPPCLPRRESASMRVARSREGIEVIEGVDVIEGVEVTAFASTPSITSTPSTASGSEGEQHLTVLRQRTQLIGNDEPVIAEAGIRFNAGSSKARRD